MTGVIGLGSNLGDREQNLAAAAAAVTRIGAETRRSPIYGAAPLGPAQPDFLNAILVFTTALEPEAVVVELLAIEQSLGRVRRERWGPRIIDLDLLVLGDRVLRTPVVTLPHPGIASRPFVLRPWSDVAPDMVIPGLGTVSELLRRLPEEARRQVWRHDQQWSLTASECPSA